MNKWDIKWLSGGYGGSRMGLTRQQLSSLQDRDDMASGLVFDDPRPSFVKERSYTPKQQALKKLNQIRNEITGEKTMSTIKFSTVDDGGKVRNMKVREMCKVSTAIRVVGLQYTRSLREASKMEIGTELYLKAEPTNIHDSNAVAVYDGDKRIGYIERAEASVVRDVILTMGEEAVRAIVSRVDSRADIYNMLWVVIETTYYVKA